MRLALLFYAASLVCVVGSMIRGDGFDGLRLAATIFVITGIGFSLRGITRQKRDTK